MSNQKIAVVGDKDSVTAFRAAGVDVFAPTDREQTQALVHTLAKQGYALILITEDNAEQISQFIQDSKSAPYPIILPIPSADGKSELARHLLKQNMEKAIGMDILFNKEEGI